MNSDTLIRGIRTSSTVGAVFLAVLGLIAYIPGLRLLGSLRPEFIPMAPSTAIFFILLGLPYLIDIKKIQSISVTIQ